MATVANSFITPQVVDLRRGVTSLSLRPVLEDQKRFWLRELGWDFTPSMNAIAGLVEQRDLAGFALRYGNVVVGYSYYIIEDRKGIIGDLHLLEPFRNVDNESLLMEASLRDLMSIEGIRRIEAQLMSLTDPFQRQYPLPEFNQNYQREVMEAPLPTRFDLTPRDSTPGAAILSWNQNMMEEAGDLMARSYAGHIDSRINDQYRSASVARRFLQSIVEHPGCGSFAESASYVAFGTASRRMEGMSLASLVGPGGGHITQICVSPEARRNRVGYRLLESSMASLMRLGCNRVSLSVTSWNREAISLYEQMGFVRRRSFTAAIWEGFPVR